MTFKVLFITFALILIFNIKIVKIHNSILALQDLKSNLHNCIFYCNFRKKF